ncbi:MAG: CocE/NonD family hydrolase [Acidobacteriota bacterium]|nr:CocE/NonD family hydrolase [Acidobacteriota bacterium]
MRRGFILMSALVAAAALAAVDADRQPFSHWDESKLSPPQYRVRVVNKVRIKMRDGVELSTDVYLPDAPGKYPALLWRNCYGKNGAADQSAWFASRGYAVVHQDTRGKYESGGRWVHFRDEADNGFDTDEWIGAQPWSNGKIGLMGGSYLGYTQIAQAVRRSKYLASMSASVTTGDVYNGWVYSDGALFLGFAFPWGAVVMDAKEMQFETASPWPEIFNHLPLMTMDEKAGHPNPNYREWLEHPRADDSFWKDLSYEKEIANIDIPFLVVEGWYDLLLRGALRDHILITTQGKSERARRNKHLIIGPWPHETGARNNDPKGPSTGPDRSLEFGPAAELETRKIYLRWHDHWLKGIDNGVDKEPPVRIFVMGENYWRYENEWPPRRARYVKYYLGGGKANSVSGSGTLSTVKTAGAADDRFLYDPGDPVPTLGGNTCCSDVPTGPRNQIKAERRDDVLVYSTPELTEAVEVTGPITVKLYAATRAPDTDWTAKLVDVHPDGYAQNLADGIIRARYRAGKEAPAALLEPGRIYEYDIDLWATSNVFLPGHRIRVEISSSNFPRFDRNLNTGEDPMTATRMEKAAQTVYRSAEYPSHIVLPIIPGPPK